MPGEAADDATAGLRSVRIERRGGLAGLKPAAEIEAAALTGVQRRALATLLGTPSPPTATPPTRGLPLPADRFSYRVTTTAADGSTTVCTVDEDRMPAVLARLCRPAEP